MQSMTHVNVIPLGHWFVLHYTEQFYRAAANSLWELTKSDEQLKLLKTSVLVMLMSETECTR